MTPQPIISTVVLNWNRADLLALTLSSYQNTITLPYELFIVDNASTDHSRTVIEDFCCHNPQATALFLSENKGGEAINLGLQRAQGQYLHISENDFEYLPQWAEISIDLFEVFPELGQLSLFGPLPADDTPGGVGVVPPSQLRHAQGRIIYEMQHNVGTACIIRRQIWDQGIRVHSLPEQNGVIFPNDGRLSTEIKKAGYLVARTDRCLVKNKGHTVSELKQRQDYYLANYRAKPWLGEAGLQKRIAQWEKADKPGQRQCFLWPELSLLREKSQPHSACAEPHLWSMLDEWTPEIETLEFLYAFIRLVKPRVCVETGTWRGFTAVAIGQALKHNGRGHLWSLEQQADIGLRARQFLQLCELQQQVNIVETASFNFKPQEPIEVLMLDADISIRIQEFQYFKPYLAPQAWVIIHDAAHATVNQGIQQLVETQQLTQLYLPTPRGLALCQSLT